MVSRRQEHINPRIHIHSQDRPHATQPCTMLKSAEREMHQPNTKGHYGIRSVFGGRVDCGRIHRHLGVVAAVSKLGRTPGDSAADGRRICRPIPHNRRWSDDRRQSDGRRRIDIRHRRTTHRSPRQAPRHRAYPDHSNVRHHITGAGQNRHAGMADESVAARHRHHAGHVLLRGADSPPRPARIAAATSERRFAGFAWHGDCLRVQPAAVRGVVDFPGRLARSVFRVRRRGRDAFAGWHACPATRDDRAADGRNRKGAIGTVNRINRIGAISSEIP